MLQTEFNIIPTWLLEAQLPCSCVLVHTGPKCLLHLFSVLVSHSHHLSSGFLQRSSPLYHSLLAEFGCHVVDKITQGKCNHCTGCSQVLVSRAASLVFASKPSSFCHLQSLLCLEQIFPELLLRK